MDDNRILVAIIAVLLLLCLMKSVHIEHREDFRGRITEYNAEWYWPWED